MTAPADAIRCSSLVAAYGDFVAVDGLDLVVRRGECLGLLGPNGAGKTTTIEVLEGLIKPRSGDVEVLGLRWGASRASDRALRSRIGVALQETRLSEKLTVRETLRLFRSFYAEGRDVDDLTGFLGLTDKAGVRVERLSGGLKQRLAVACALVGAPEMLFLDEPTTGLDPHARREIWDIVRGLMQGGATVLLTTHYMEEAAQLCDRVAVIDRGKLVAIDTPGALVRMLGATEVIEMRPEGNFPAHLAAALQGVKRADLREGAVVLLVDDSAAVLPRLLEAVEKAGARARAIATHPATLDDVFLHLTGRGLRDE